MLPKTKLAGSLLALFMLLFSLNTPGVVQSMANAGARANAISRIAEHGAAVSDDPVAQPYKVFLPVTQKDITKNLGEMITIPAGEFQMGCDPAHNGGEACAADEVPLHNVSLPAYRIDKYEVTNAQYALCVTAGACDPAPEGSRTRLSYSNNPGFADYPVVMAYWQDAVDYCTWAGKRLPTEAEWEKAARGTADRRTYPWGDQSPDCTLANLALNQGGSYCMGDTTEVGIYPSGSSPYGVMDMAGNVNEWVSDWYGDSYYSQSSRDNPTGPASGSLKGIRGGSWDYAGGTARVSARGAADPTYPVEPYIPGPPSPQPNLGVRCASSSMDNLSPTGIYGPSPEDKTPGVGLTPMLSWKSYGDPDRDLLTFDVFLESWDDTPDVLVSNGQAAASFVPSSPLEANSVYYWQIVARDEHGLTTSGPVWRFSTGDGSPVVPGEMVRIPAGEFQMGCDPASSSLCYWQEFPLHTVYLDEYYIDKYEVTNAQYSECVTAGKCAAVTSSTISANHPVTGTTQQNAIDYCTWAGKWLPSEAEWEKAARGADGVLTYPWGDQAPNCALANYGDCVGSTAPVGSYPAGASPYGARDMAGNVFEWTSDLLGYQYYSISAVNNPAGSADDEYGIGLRGGDWGASAASIRVSPRSPALDDYTLEIGFRCASSGSGNQRPTRPSLLSPAHKLPGIGLTPELSWASSDPDGDPLTFDIYLQKDDPTPDTLISAAQSGTSFTPTALLANSLYYWQVVAKDDHGHAAYGPVWRFITGDGTPVTPGEMVTIPAGSFQMGCDPAHNGGYECGADELPLHSVYLDAYSIDKYEVTNAQYAACVTAGNCAEPGIKGSNRRESYYDHPDYANYPVIFVYWQDAANYCTWAGKRLPTEAEWEKAARGSSDTRAYPWGDTLPNCTLANSGFSQEYIFGTCLYDTGPVGAYPAGASPYGVRDLAGNVAEWVSDWWGTDYYSTSPAANPTGPATGIFKVVRGGNYFDPYGLLRVPVRSHSDLSTWSGGIGFRCADTP